MKKDAKILIAGHQGMVGSSLYRRLQSLGYTSIIAVGRDDIDFTHQEKTTQFLQREKPDYLFITAAKVGGILANSLYPAEFCYENLMIQANLIHGAYQAEVQKLMFLGSSCIYPKFAEQPIKENQLLSGYLEPTNEAYAIAKIAGIKLVESYARQYGCDYISIMPCNLYGYGDNFHPKNSHVLPGMIYKFHNAVKENRDEVTLWGSGSSQREFMFIDDLIDAMVFLMDNFHGPEFINVGTGKEISIKQLAILIAKITGFQGNICWDSTKPDGTPRKVMDINRLTSLGWEHKTSFAEGVRKTYAWFQQNQASIRS